MCPVEKGCTVPQPLTFLPQPLVARGVQVALPRAGPGLLQRRRKLAAPILVECCATGTAEDGTVADTQQKPCTFLSCSRSTPMDKYDVLEVLGQGSSAVVRRAKRLADGQEVALKTVRTDDEELIEIARKEYEMLRSIEHPNIIHTFEFFTTADRAVVVMEFYDGEPLDRNVCLSTARCFAEARARELFQQLLQALAYLHGRGIVHRDIKGQNVLVSRAAKLDLRLVDFNVACCLSDGSLTPTGTPDYLAPEVIAGQSASEASDMWAAGLCLLLMLAGGLPRRCDTFASTEDFEAAILRRCSRNEELSESCLAVLRSCLASDQESRPSAEALLSEQWLSTCAVDCDSQTPDWQLSH